MSPCGTLINLNGYFDTFFYSRIVFKNTPPPVILIRMATVVITHPLRVFCKKSAFFANFLNKKNIGK